MSNYTITNAVFAAEVARRKEPRATRTRCSAMLAKKELKVPASARKHVESVLMGMGTADLADAVELLAPKAKPAPAPARKRTQAQARAEFAAKAKARKGTGVGGPEHTAARAQAMLLHKAAKAAGEKLTYRDACIACGTLPAKELEAQLANA